MRRLIPNVNWSTSFSVDSGDFHGSLEKRGNIIDTSLKRMLLSRSLPLWKEWKP